LHQNAFGGLALPGPAGSYSASPDPLAVIRGKERREWEGKVWDRKGQEGG